MEGELNRQPGILITCGVGVSDYTLEEVIVCCNSIGARSTTLVGRRGKPMREDIRATRCS